MKKYLVYQAKYLFLIIIFMLSWTVESAKIIFDLGGVLIDKKQSVALKILGRRNVLWYMLTKRCWPTTMKKMLNHKLYEVLNKEEIINQLSITINKHGIKDDNGTSLPPVMCSWLEGTIPCKKIKTVVSYAINNHPEWFSSSTEQRMIKATIQLLFTPEKFCQMMQFNANALKFVDACKKKGHQVFVLSNWDKESFSLLQANNRKIFDRFDGIVISGDHNCAKPNKKIYQKLITQYNLNPAECIFIDDQLENCTAAKTIGIHPIHCEKNEKLFTKRKKRKKMLSYIAAIHRKKNKKFTGSKQPLTEYPPTF